MIVKQITLRCDMPECGRRTSFGELVDCVTEARRRGRRIGWARRDRQDLCPSCAVRTDLRR